MEMRRKDRALDIEETMQLLEKTEYGVLSTVGEDGVPYGVPLNYALVRQSIYFHGANAEGHKIQNIKNSGKASFTVIDHTEVNPAKFSTKYMSAIAFGTIQIVESDAEKRKGLEAIIRKYSSDYMESGMKYIDQAINNVVVLKLEITEVTGKGKKK